MYFEYTEEQKMIQDTARDFAENHIKPIAKQMDKDEQFPKDIWKKMGDLGFLSMTLPEEYGGSNSDTISYFILIEEVSKKSGSLGNALAGNKIGPNSLVNIGAREANNRWW